MSDTLEETLPAHAPLGPSSAEGWTTCLDYVNANRGLPDTSSKPAAEGTAAHYISDLALVTGLTAYDFVGVKTQIGENTFVWDDDDAELLQPGLDQIEAAAKSGGLVFSELRVDISEWTLPGQHGTLDRAVIYQFYGEWWIALIDLKWGRGVPVNPIENKQIILYALAFWKQVARHHTDATKFRLIIDQPRHGGGGGVWHTTLEELLRWGEWIKGRALLTAEPNPPRTASLHGCMWCRRRRAPGGCDTFDTYMVNLLGLSWDDIDMGIMMSEEITLPRDLTPHRRSWLLLHQGSIVRWLDQLHEEAMADAEAARDTGLVKAVKGNKLPDKWKDKGVDAIPVVERLIGDEGFNKRLKTPKQIGIAVEGNPEARDAIAPFIVPGEKKIILVPLEDARLPIRTPSDFDELPNEGKL